MYFIYFRFKIIAIKFLSEHFSLHTFVCNNFINSTSISKQIHQNIAQQEETNNQFSNRTLIQVAPPSFNYSYNIRREQIHHEYD